MAISDSQFLESLAQISKQKQEQFMDRIAERLGRSRGTKPLPNPFQGAPDFWRKQNVSLEERIEQFMSNWRKAGGEAHCVDSLSKAQQLICDAAASINAKRIICQHHPALQSMKLAEKLAGTDVTVWGSLDSGKFVQQAAEAEIGIAIADYAVANTGSIVLMSGKDHGRTISLLPPVFIAVVPISRMKTRLGEVMAEIHSLGRDNIPAGIHFVSGPSRSADIENDLTIGVHGPGRVHAILADF